MDKTACRIRNPKRMRNLAGKGRMQGNTSFPGCRWKDCVMLFFAFIPPHSSGPLFTFISSSNIFDYFGFLIRNPFFGIFSLCPEADENRSIFSLLPVPDCCIIMPCSSLLMIHMTFGKKALWFLGALSVFAALVAGSSIFWFLRDEPSPREMEIQSPVVGNGKRTNPDGGGLYGAPRSGTFPAPVPVPQFPSY